MTRETAQALLREIVQVLDCNLYEDMYLFDHGYEKWDFELDEATDIILEYMEES